MAPNHSLFLSSRMDLDGINQTDYIHVPMM